MKFIKKPAIASVLLLAFISGCSGGAGPTGSTVSSLVYEGSSAQAVMDGSTAVDTTVGAYQGGGSGASMIGLASVATSADTREGSRTVELAGILRDAVGGIDLSSQQGISRVLVSDSGTLPDSCSGSTGTASYVISIDPLSGTFVGNFSFNAYCSGGTTLNGTTTYSGTIDLGAMGIGQMSLSFGSLEVSNPTDSFTAGGDVSFDLSTNPAVVNMTMVMRDNLTMETTKVENLAMSMADNSVYVDLVMSSGRFYHPVHGYADCSTTSPIRLYHADDWPSTGVLVCEGAGASMARLTFTSITQYRVEADADGDGVFEFDTGLNYWASL